MTDHAQAVIIGGGVGGCSIAYHLTDLGWRDIVLVERSELTSGSTFHSAGLVGQLRSSVSLTRMMMYSVELYRRLKDETGKDPGWREVGSLRLASSKERLEELRRQAGWAKTFGLPLEEIGTKDAQGLLPIMSLEDVLGAVYLPTDGHIDPSGLTYALVEGAKNRGAKIRTETRVQSITVKGGRIHEVVTDKGVIRTDVVVNASGMFAPEIGRMVGITVPIIPIAHQYLITKPLDGVNSTFPTMRDPDLLVYFREEVGGLVMGGYERNPAPWGLGGIPEDFNSKLLSPDWDRFAPLMENAVRRVPSLEHAEVIKLINGPEGFTPDGEFVLGESPEVRGFFTAAGFCAHGLAGAGGIGRMMAEWIVEGEPSLDLWRMDIRRFGHQYRSQRFTLERTYEVCATYYDIHYPNEERQSARGLRLSPTHARLKELGAVFGEKAGWERANWFETNAKDGSEANRPRGWASRYWSPAIEAEHLATREQVAIFDETSFSKIEILGPGALPFLQHLTANEMDKPVGSVTYTQMLNKHGGIECDLTVTRLAQDRFMLITGTAFGTHDMGWIMKHLPSDGSVCIKDVTSSWACLGLWGPRARDILQSVTEADVSNGGFPYLTAKEIVIGLVPVLALRVTYVGELGWELYCPMEYGLRLWDTLWDAGMPHGLVAAGYRAIDSLRLEKGYRYWSADITPEHNPFEAGLGFAVRINKGEFIGREALLNVKERGITRRLCCMTLEDFHSVALGGEPIRSGDRIVGRVTSGGMGYSVGKSIAYGYLPVDYAVPGTGLYIEIFGQWLDAVVEQEPLWDPKGERIRA
ncbi:MAG: GcvT family protein [candidate division NC10 bacterium]|nr:GcvT family protein [candidate division NC10 bacterium]